MAADTASTRRPVDLMIRFTNSQPDLLLTLSDPSHVSALGVKARIRASLSAESASCRLRLIWAGKVLKDEEAIARSIVIPAPPPPSAPPPLAATSKGKLPARASPLPPTSARVYIHCSVGDALTAAEIQHETAAAALADQHLLDQQGQLQQDGGLKPTCTPAPTASSASDRTVQAPRGFDRLLDSGFTADEVAALRTQFLAIQAHAHTPDTMPVGTHLRALEDAWLDNDGVGAGATAADGGGAGRRILEEGEVEDMFKGVVIGFFWPVAAVCWLMREEGVWSPKYQTAVWVGAIINIAFGALRMTS